MTVQIEGVMSTNSKTWARVGSAFVAAFMTLAGGVAAAQDATTSVVGQQPLTVSNVPGNLVLVPSVEFPTVDSIANLGNYTTSRLYTGYFDPTKCYNYSYNDTESERHFYPASDKGNVAATCSQSNKEWSGNYLNWAATQTIDPFRKGLTGGYRVKDTTTTTWLEKARSDSHGRGGAYFPDRRVPSGSGNNSTLVGGATPASWDYFRTRIGTLGNKMWFTADGDLSTAASNVVAYDPDNSRMRSGTVYEVSIRVKVCDSAVGLESNCVNYSGNYKPEGLIQKYSRRIRYSVFGYLNDGSSTRDGGVLRARQKFVGSQQLDPSNGAWADNARREWNPTTGVLVTNPDSSDAEATSGATITNSGVINYINKFGQLTTRDHKSYDPVSELFYAALRYLKNQGNVSAYTDLTGTSAENYNLADGFPVITNWDDPMQYRCQNNALLGIGDVYTHLDKNLPGNTIRTGEPTEPSAVGSDDSVNVMTRTQQIATLEGITINQTGAFTGRNNSAYIAGLAYHANTEDLRSDLDEKQTASTYWVDVREGQTLERRAANQYWLAAKYGGFTLPENVTFDPDTRTTALPADWWNSGETLENGDARPKNFYVASDPDTMIESLRRAFASIGKASGSGSSLGVNSARIEAGTRVYQTQFYSDTWRGELKSFTIDTIPNNGIPDGSLVPAPGSTIAADWNGSDAAVADRIPIYVNNPESGYTEFEWDNLSDAQQDLLESEAIVNYLRGDRTNEDSRQGGTLRTRTGLLGDIVNSTPVYVGSPNGALYARATFTGASSYDEFAAAQASRAPVVYVGANDGMLHGFNASTGAERYAFVPNASIVNGLKEYSDPLYEHRYFVDGEMAIADVYDTSGTGRWRTVLVGTMGRGGPGVFALDVTNPTNVQFLWEKGTAEIPDLGRNVGRPVIAQVANGDWRVIFGNGPDNSGQTAQLVTITALTGTVATVQAGTAGTTTNPNGLTAVLARDSNADGFPDVAYAGDLQGNMWKFTGLSGTPVAQKIFQATAPGAGAAQPITAAPLAGKDPNTGITWVFFGTGRYLTKTDLTNRQVQTWYGIKDEGYGDVTTRGQLVQRSILTEVTPVDDEDTPEDESEGLILRTVDEGTAADVAEQRGWYMDLVSPVAGAQGERMVVPNRFQGAALIGTTRIPNSSDACNPGGSGFIMAIDPFTGGRLKSTFFDANRDGQFNDGDLSGDDIASGIGFGTGANQPNFIENEMYVSMDDGKTEHLKVQGGSSEAGRMSWRELVN